MRTLASSVRGVVDATTKFTRTTEVLWRRREGTAILSRGVRLNPGLDRLYLVF